MENAYQHLLAEAIVRNLKFGIDVPNDELRSLRTNSHTSFSTLDNIQGAFSHVYKSLGGFSSDDLKGNCIKYGIEAKSLFDEYLGITSVLTVGYVIDNGKEYYRFGEQGIERLINRMPEKNHKINAHVWLTLPTFEVLDLTYLETKQNLAGMPFTTETGFKYVFDSVVGVYFKHKLEYCPMLVGQDSLFKLGFASYQNVEA
jgi:hypothetical protein